MMKHLCYVCGEYLTVGDPYASIRAPDGDGFAAVHPYYAEPKHKSLDNETIVDINERIRQAYREGFNDGADHQNLPWKYPPINIAWRVSEARELITGSKEPGRYDRTWMKDGNVTDEEEKS